MKILIPEKFNKLVSPCSRMLAMKSRSSLTPRPKELVEMIPEYDALIVRSATTVTREVIEAGTKLKIIGRAGGRRQHRPRGCHRARYHRV